MKKITMAIVIVTILLVIGLTSFKVIKKHNDTVLMVSEKRIVEAAIKCKREDKCKNNKVTLKQLYENGYLKTEINPLTKEIYNDSSYVLIDENKFVVTD